MKKVYIIILLSITALQLFGQNKTREIIVTRNDTVIKCRVLNEAIKYSPAPGKLYYWYKAQEIYSNRGGYDGLLLSEYFSVYVNNILIEKGEFKEGVKHGEWKKWYLNGEIKSVETYKNGLKNGKSYYYSDNRLNEIRTYRKGLLHGDCQQYIQDSTKTIHYRKGEIQVKDNNKFKLFKQKEDKKDKEETTQEH